MNNIPLELIIGGAANASDKNMFITIMIIFGFVLVLPGVIFLIIYLTILSKI